MLLASTLAWVLLTVLPRSVSISESTGPIRLLDLNNHLVDPFDAGAEHEPLCSCSSAPTVQFPIDTHRKSADCTSSSLHRTCAFGWFIQVVSTHEIPFAHM